MAGSAVLQSALPHVVLAIVLPLRALRLFICRRRLLPLRRHELRQPAFDHAGANAGAVGGVGVGDFLAGDVSTSSIAVGNPERFVRVNGYNFFGQDSIQITRKLNLNFGLRYEYFGPL